MGRTLERTLSLLLGALAGCEGGTGDSWGDACPEYGCYESCTVMGLVRDADSGQGIEGIQIGQAWSELQGTGETGPGGAFVVESSECCGELRLVFVDVDGEDGGGCYARHREEVKVHSVGLGSTPCTTLGHQLGEAVIELQGEPPPCELEDTGL